MLNIWNWNEYWNPIRSGMKYWKTHNTGDSIKISSSNKDCMGLKFKGSKGQKIKESIKGFKRIKSINFKESKRIKENQRESKRIKDQCESYTFSHFSPNININQEARLVCNLIVIRLLYQERKLGYFDLIVICLVSHN